MKGKVKWFNESKGYGFIAAEDGQDVFCHIKAVPGGVVPTEGQSAEFEVEKGPKALRAANVRLLSLMLVAALLLVATGGCSGLIAAADYKACLATQCQGVISKPQALGANAAVFAAQGDTATLNLFAWLAGEKRILASAVILSDLQRKASLTAEANNRTWTPADLTTVGQVESLFASDTLAQANATAATTQIFTRAVLAAKSKAIQARSPRAPPSAVLAELIASLPTSLQAWAAQYGSALVNQGIDQANAAIAYLIAGDQDAAYRIALHGMTNEELLVEMISTLNAVDIPATNENAASVAAQRAAAQALATVGISVLLALIGL